MGSDSCSQPTDYQHLKMGVYDGVYQLDMSQADPNWAAMHKEMGIPEADTKAMISGGNVHTMTVMENKDGSFTTSTNNTVVPHHNSSFTSKPGEIKKMEKPFPCTVSWNYRGENESVMNIEMGNGKKLVNEYCMNNYGFTCTTSMEGSSLKARAVFWKVSPKEDGYYEMETEKGMFPVLQQLMPQMTEDAWKELIKNGGVAMKLKVDKTKAVMEERMSGGQGKTVDFEMNFTEHGVFETMTVGGLSASCFYRRLGRLRDARADEEPWWRKDFNEEQLEVHAGGERDEARGAVGDRDVWFPNTPDRLKIAFVSVCLSCKSNCKEIKTPPVVDQHLSPFHLSYKWQKHLISSLDPSNLVVHRS